MKDDPLIGVKLVILLTLGVVLPSSCVSLMDISGSLSSISARCAP